MKAPEAKVAKKRKDAAACEHPIAFVTIDLLASVVPTFPTAPTHLDVETPLARGRLATSSGSNRLQARTVSLRSSLAYYVDHQDTPAEFIAALGQTSPHSPNTKIIVAFFARSFISGVLVNLPTWLRVRPVAIAMYCLPSIA
jgi:hypothetical protein